MLGGYYLGQLYLGISGLPAGSTLSVKSSSPQLSSDNINLTQKHIFNMINKGTYIRNYGGEYEKSTGGSYTTDEKDTGNYIKIK